jgi:hypothetical protein
MQKKEYPDLPIQNSIRIISFSGYDWYEMMVVIFQQMVMKN